MPVRKRRQTGLRLPDFALSLVVFKWHHGSEGVNCNFFTCYTEHVLGNLVSLVQNRLFKFFFIHKFQMFMVQFTSRWYLCTQKSPYDMCSTLVSQNFPQHCLWNSSNVHLIKDGPLSSIQRRPSSTSSFHASLVQVVSGVLLNTSDLPRSKPLVRIALPASVSAWSFPFIPECLYHVYGVSYYVTFHLAKLVGNPISVLKLL